MPNNYPDALYVHVPFCLRICPYCDFCKVIYRPEWSKPYLDALYAEAKARQCGLFSTIYVGGGTPSALPDEEFEELLFFLHQHIKQEGEFSIECNPENVTETKVALMKRFGIDRVSLGVQSFQPESLKTLGRRHDKQTVLNAIGLLRKYGITNINLDWMYGFPGQSEESLRADIEDFLSCDVPHLSAYSLILEEGTTFSAKKVKPLEDDVQQDYFELIMAALAEHGYERYEISNFAKPGYRCRHNLTYWHDERYVAIGLGASGYIGNKRYQNTKNLQKYLNGEYFGSEEELSRDGELMDYMLTNLRLIEGFSLAEFEKRFGMTFDSHYHTQFARMEREGLLVEDSGRIHATKRGLDLLDYICLELF